MIVQKIGIPDSKAALKPTPLAQVAEQKALFVGIDLSCYGSSVDRAPCLSMGPEEASNGDTPQHFR